MKYLVFDFDGTIADTLPVVEELGREILKKYTAETIDTELARKIGLKRVIMKVKIPKWAVPKAFLELKQKLNQRIGTDVRLFPGMHEVLKELASGYTLGIVSSNSGENVKLFLANNKITELFRFIHCDSSIFGKHIVLKHLCKEYKMDPADMVYIGDEDRDIQAAKKLKIPVIAVAWGYNAPELLTKEQPDYLIDSPDQILDYFGLKN